MLYRIVEPTIAIIGVTLVHFRITVTIYSYVKMHIRLQQILHIVIVFRRKFTNMSYWLLKRADMTTYQAIQFSRTVNMLVTVCPVTSAANDPDDISTQLITPNLLS